MVKVIVVDQNMYTSKEIKEGKKKENAFQELVEVIESLGENDTLVFTDPEEGGNAEAAQKIYGEGKYEIKEVEESESPGWGMVWLKEDEEDGSLELYKKNFAT